MLCNNGWALIVAVFLLRQRDLSLLSAYILQIAHLWKIFWREWKCKKKLCDALHTNCSVSLSVTVLCTMQSLSCCCRALRSRGWVSFHIVERTSVENILKVAKLDFCLIGRPSLSVAYCVKSHLATLRTYNQMLAIFSPLQWSALDVLLPWLVGSLVGSLHWCHASWVCNNLSAVWAVDRYGVLPVCGRLNRPIQLFAARCITSNNH